MSSFFIIGVNLSRRVLMTISELALDKAILKPIRSSHGNYCNIINTRRHALWFILKDKTYGYTEIKTVLSIHPSLYYYKIFNQLPWFLLNLFMSTYYSVDGFCLMKERVKTS